jgi:hypothetical protein
MNWYYAKHGKQEGPIPEQVFCEMLARGEVMPEDLVWREGMRGWSPAGEVAELASRSEAPHRERTVGAGSVGTSSPPSPPECPEVEGVSPVEQPVPGRPYSITPPATSGLAIASMVCGIISLPLCWIWAAAGIPAVICGHMALKAIKHSETPVEGRGMAIAGLVTGYLAILIQFIFIGVMVFFVVMSP